MKWLEKANEIAFEVVFLFAGFGLIATLAGGLWQAIRSVWGF